MTDFKTQFEAFCNYGVPGGKKNTITDKNVTKLFKDCKLYGKKLTTTDTDIGFSKVKTKGSKELNIEQFKTLLKEVAPKYMADHKLGSADDAVTKMSEEICSRGPASHGTTGQSKTGGVDRMTDTSKYTGAHKERFDESGKGKGTEGRKDTVEASGYVGQYKGEGSYDKK